MPEPTTIPDQSDILAQLDTARASLATALATAGGLQGQVTLLTGERDTHLAAVTAANATIATLNATVATQTATLATFDTRVAAAVAQHGIRKDAIAAEATEPAKAKLSLTEQCIAARATMPKPQ